MHPQYDFNFGNSTLSFLKEKCTQPDEVILETGVMRTYVSRERRSPQLERPDTRAPFYSNVHIVSVPFLNMYNYSVAYDCTRRCVGRN